MKTIICNYSGISIIKYLFVIYKKKKYSEINSLKCIR